MGFYDVNKIDAHTRTGLVRACTGVFENLNITGAVRLQALSRVAVFQRDLKCLLNLKAYLKIERTYQHQINFNNTTKHLRCWFKRNGTEFGDWLFCQNFQ